MGNIASSNVGNPKAERPPVSKGKVIGEVFAAVVAMAAAAGGSLLIFVIFLAAYSGDFAIDWMDDLAAILPFWLLMGGPVVLPFSAAITVYFIGRIGEQTGSFWATLGLSIVGTILAASAWIVAASSEIHVGDATLNVLFLLCALLGPSLGAVMGFNLTHRYKKGCSPDEIWS